MTAKTVPPCVGYYEVADQNCDGDSQGATDAARRSCDWRERCVAFRRHLGDNGLSQGDFLELVEGPVLDGDGNPAIDGAGEPMRREIGRARKGGEAFSQFCERLIQEYAEEAAPTLIEQLARDGQPKPRERPRPRPRKTERRGVYPRARARRARMLKPFEVFLNALITRIGPERKKKRGHAAMTGQIYTVSRLKSRHRDGTDYITVYYATSKGRDQTLVRVQFRPLFGTFDVMVPATAEELRKALGKDGRERVGVESLKRALPYSRARRLDDEGLAIMVKAIARLVKCGTIKLPALSGSAK